MNTLVDGSCDIFDKGDTVADTSVRGVSIGVCQNLRIYRDRFIQLLDKTYVKESDIMESTRNFARGKLSEIASRKLAKSMTDSSMQVQQSIAVKFAPMLIRMHRIKLIKEGCDAIQYLNYGEDQPYCKILRETPDDGDSLIELTNKRVA